MLLSPLFMYTFIGVVTPVFGITLCAFYSKRWTLIACTTLSLIGVVLALCNPSPTVWDLIVSVGASVTVVVGVFMGLVIATAVGAIDAPRATAVATYLGLVERV